MTAKPFAKKYTEDGLFFFSNCPDRGLKMPRRYVSIMKSLLPHSHAAAYMDYNNN